MNLDTRLSELTIGELCAIIRQEMERALTLEYVKNEPNVKGLSEIARFLGVSKQTVIRWRKEKKLGDAMFTVGGQYYLITDKLNQNGKLN